MTTITSNTIVIDIMRPVEEVYNYTINPVNTPLWLSFILEEKTSDDKVIIGTIYRQKIDIGGGASIDDAFVVTEVVPNKIITMKKNNGTYYCTYKYEKIDGGTRLTYFEDTGSGEDLKDPLDRDVFEKLKGLIERTA